MTTQTVTHNDIVGAVLVGTIIRKQAAELVRVLGMYLADDWATYDVRLDVRQQNSLDNAPDGALAASLRLGSSMFGADMTITDSVVFTANGGE